MTVTVYVPTVPEHVRVKLAAFPNATLVGLKEHDKPDGGETATARFTVPLKPARPVTVIVDVARLDGKTGTEAGFADMVKSGKT